MGIFNKLFIFASVCGSCAQASTTTDQPLTVEQIARFIDPDWESIDERIRFDAYESPHDERAAQDPYLKRSITLAKGATSITLLAFMELPSEARNLILNHLGVDNAKTVLQSLDQNFSDEIFALQVHHSTREGNATAFRGLLFIDQSEHGGLCVHFLERLDSPTSSEVVNQALFFPYGYSTLKWVQTTYDHPIQEIIFGYPGMPTENVIALSGFPSWKAQGEHFVTKLFTLCSFSPKNIDELLHHFPQIEPLLNGQNSGLVVFAEQKPAALIFPYTKGKMAMKFTDQTPPELIAEILACVQQTLGDALNFFEI